MMLDKAHITYETLYAEDHVEEANKYNISNVPALIVTDETHSNDYRGIQGILTYITEESLKK
jgi:hypothetical protein